MKKCRGCGETKPLKQFHRMAKSPDGRRPRCKECRKPESREWYDANAETIRARTAEWQAKNHRRHSENARRWRRRNREHKRALDRRWYEANGERRRAYNRLPHVREAARLNAKTQKAKRKAQMGATVEPITPEQWRELKASYCGLCVYCNRRIERATMDHIDPLNLGGSHGVENVVPACGRCNRAKSDKPLIVFLAERIAA